MKNKKLKKRILDINTGEKNGMWTGGKPHCPVCDKEISYQAKFCRNHVDRSYLHTPEMIKRSTDRLLDLIENEKTHPRWLGENAGYVSKHKWVAKHLGIPSKCENCGTTDERRYEWSNISGLYKREFTDWRRLCVPCHRKVDDIGNKVWKARRSKTRI